MKLANTLIVVGAVAVSVGVGLWDYRAGLIVGGAFAIAGGYVLSLE